MNAQNQGDAQSQRARFFRAEAVIFCFVGDQGFVFPNRHSVFAPIGRQRPTIEHQSACATVLMIDVSHSMILYGEDRITPAKQAALALSELILTRYPKDSLSVVLFGDDAWEVKIRDIPYVSVGPYHTNTKAGLQLAQKLLARQKHVNKQIFMITDGKPSAIFENGRFYKNAFGLDPRIVNKTMDEAVACRRKRIPITTFMIATDPALVDFVDTLTKVARGRAYYASPTDLASFVFRDYIRNRKKLFR